MTRVVVLGGGFAGVLAASVLRAYADEVIVVEADRYPASPGPRRGLPQAHHSHVLVTGGAVALGELLPGVLEALDDRGAHRRELPGEALLLMAEGWCRSHPTGAYLVSGTRGLFDQVVRSYALAHPAVSVWQGTRVRRLVGDAGRVCGVVVGQDAVGQDRVGQDRAHQEMTVPADLVVDATGRSSRAGQWLQELGGQRVEEVVVATGLAYATRFYRAPPELTDTIPAIMIHPRPDVEFPGRGATVYPVEHGRWIVTLTTRDGAPPRRDPDFLAFARSLRHPIVADLLAAARPLGPIRRYRDTVNRRRYFERTHLPEGFVVLGDALAAVNPVHSHGMSVAALSARRLGRELDRHSVDPALSRHLQSAMAEEVERSWQMAVGQDGQLAGGRHRQRSTPTPVSSLHQRVARDVLTKPAVAARFFAAQALTTPDPGADGSPPAAPAAVPTPRLSAEEAIAQHPSLADWRRPPRPGGQVPGYASPSSD